MSFSSVFLPLALPLVVTVACICFSVRQRKHARKLWITQ
jgi:cytochrome c biogenesis factor